MLQMRHATHADRPQVAAMIRARCDWLEHNGLESWRDAVDELADQCDNPEQDLWVLDDRPLTRLAHQRLTYPPPRARVAGPTNAHIRQPRPGDNDKERQERHSHR